MIITRKVVALVLAGMITAGMAGIGSWAYFSDPEHASENVLLTGTIDLSISVSGTGPTGKYTVTPGGDKVNGNVVMEKLLPGESGNITWVLANKGILDAVLDITSSVSFSENSTNEIENAVTGNNGGGNGDLDRYIGVKLQRGVGTDEADAIAGFVYILGSAGSYVPLSGLEDVLNAQAIAVAGDSGNDTVVYRLSWSIASPLYDPGPDGIFGTGDDFPVNDNIIQSDTARIDITFTLNQVIS